MTCTHFQTIEDAALPAFPLSPPPSHKPPNLGLHHIHPSNYIYGAPLMSNCQPSFYPLPFLWPWWAWVLPNYTRHPPLMPVTMQQSGDSTGVPWDHRKSCGCQRTDCWRSLSVGESSESGGEDWFSAGVERRGQRHSAVSDAKDMKVIQENKTCLILHARG